MKAKSSNANGKIIEIRTRFNMYKPPIGLNRTRNIVYIDINAINSMEKTKLTLL